MVKHSEKSRTHHKRIFVRDVSNILYSGYFLLFLFFFAEDVNSDQRGDNRCKHENLANNAAERVIKDIVDEPAGRAYKARKTYNL